MKIKCFSNLNIFFPFFKMAGGEAQTEWSEPLWNVDPEFEKILQIYCGSSQASVFWDFYDLTHFIVIYITSVTMKMVFKRFNQQPGC